ncbi:ankyrin repeat domain-containing protein [Paenibacillus sp. UMB7766-LJ446]|uniref:ankyrin repeat domain-containing protein n=1 Tax=Paenibacillus sp. UMB7766-LJ446 TaxID=3046313 RepID=UPI00254C4B01|nr:ankyrin repeat domain-containing protein [Paenibacillus sp. UMB7766-LJ446]MDK8191888.1 ankyrin repeat domain-containing protein [Paenibacillus sp. UMB7766-LJ446]
MLNTIHAAAEAGHTDDVLRFISQGAGLNDRDTRGRTALLAAVHGNKPETARLLIEAGADVNIQDQRLDNMLLYASAEGLRELVELAIKAGADTRLTNRFGGTALIPAADRGHVDIVEILLTSTDVDVNHINNLGWTALLEAVILGDGGTRHQQIVALLLQYGADPLIADRDGVTALAHARRNHYIEMEPMLTQS